MLKLIPNLLLVFLLLTSSSPAAGLQIRLAGSGSTRCSGRVEIYYNSAWGTVCDDGWDLDDAMVVCRQVGCGTALSAPESAYYGPGTGEIWLDDVTCSGSERSITECQHGGFGQHNCGHGEDAGVVCSVNLPKPSISMNPTAEVTWGRDVSITCSVSTQHLGGTFILQKTSGSFRKLQTSSTNSATFSIPQVDFDNEGSYQCQYQTQVSSRGFSSPLSDSVRLSVTVSLPKPGIFMNPTGEVTWGQDVSITCSVSTQHLGGTFILQKTSGSFRKLQTSSTNSATFSIPQVDFNNEGSYQCQYQTQVSSRGFSSPLSDSVRLSVTVTLQQPSIYLTSPNGGLVWGPEGAEVTKGYSVVFTCSINSTYPGGVFSLISSGSNITNTEPAVNHSASFNVPVAEYEHQGNYSCVYEVTLSSRKFTSTMTAMMNVAIKLPLVLLASSVAVGILLLLLLVLVLVCLVLRRRQRAKQPGALVQTQLTVRNQYEDSEDEEHYVNFEPVHSRKRQKEEQRGTEGEDSDEDHDSEGEEDNEGHIYMGSEDIYFIVEDNGEEEVYEDTVGVKEAANGGESNDPDDDYVTVQQPFAEDTLDIYEEHEDIYQNY